MDLQSLENGRVFREISRGAGRLLEMMVKYDAVRYVQKGLGDMLDEFSESLPPSGKAMAAFPQAVCNIGEGRKKRKN